MSRIEKWHTKQFGGYNTLIEYKPFFFSSFVKLFNTKGNKHFNNLDHFNLAAIFLSNKIINADGRRSINELNFTKKFYEKFLGKEKAESAMYMLEKYHQVEFNHEFFNSLMNDINHHLKKDQKKHLIYYLYELSGADERLHTRELNQIFKISMHLGFNKKEVNQICALYVSGFTPFTNSNGNDYRKYGTEDRSFRKKSKQHTSTRKRAISSSFKLRISLQVLGLTLNSSVSQIKAAYRKLAKANHPDQFASLGQAHVKMATEKMARINRAYEHIQSVKRFS